VPGERPRWDRVRDFAASVWDQPVRGLFFLNATSGQLPIPFVQALIALSYRPIPLSGAPGEKVVDIGIQRTLEALAPRRDDVMLASHDGDFVPQMEALLDGGRRVGPARVQRVPQQRAAQPDCAGPRDLRPRGSGPLLRPSAASGRYHLDRRLRPGRTSAVTSGPYSGVT
jgi:hypothetical protein